MPQHQRPILISEPIPNPQKTTFIGHIRHDWYNWIRWVKNDKQYNRRQEWNKYLAHPTILLEPSKYIDGRSRRNQKKIKITIEEID